MRRALAAVVFGAVLTAACEKQDGNSGATPALNEDSIARANPVRDSLGRQVGPFERPDSMMDTVRIEGMPVAMPVQIVKPAEDFPVQFTTYLPRDMQVSFERTGPRASVTFTAAFAGKTEPNAFLRFVFHDPAGGEIPADSAAALLLAGRNLGGFEREQIPAPWATSAVRFSYSDGGTRYTGSVTSGRARHVPYSVIIHYPAEYGDGMGPRVNFILRQWRWEANSAWLVQ